jgi:hypothetical protein
VKQLSEYWLSAASLLVIVAALASGGVALRPGALSAEATPVSDRLDALSDGVSRLRGDIQGTQKQLGDMAATLDRIGAKVERLARP